MSRRLIPARRTHLRRRAYTLIEMLIVCAVLAALAGMSWPAMRGVLGKARLQQAADELQTALRKARIQAVSTGGAVAFLYEPGGRRYCLWAWDSVSLKAESAEIDELPSEAVAVDDPEPVGDRTRQAPVALDAVERELPEGVRFAADDEDVLAATSDEETGSDALFLLSSGVDVATDWGAPIVFRANGRSDNADIRLVDDRRFIVDIALRGLTGIVTASTPRRLSLLQDEQSLPSDEEAREVVSEPEAAP